MRCVKIAIYFITSHKKVHKSRYWFNYIQKVCFTIEEPQIFFRYQSKRKMKEREDFFYLQIF
jgi:hypothetical protein